MFHLCEDLTRRLLVLTCKARVDTDAAGNVGKEVRVGIREFEFNVS